jgi:uncharacterized SAM-binding protein YcdF (DUF218 family)
MAPLRRVGLALAILILGWGLGLIWFVDDLDRRAGPADAETDAIVVLTGGSQRIEQGLTLLAEGKAKKLFISGVHQGVDTADMLRQAHRPAAWLQSRVILGHAADNTVGNAVETAQWLAKEGYHSVRLVTANYHMRRALLEFRRVLPADVTIIANPVFPEGARQGAILGWRGTVPVILVEYMKYLGALLRPLFQPLPSDPGNP